jgi:DnaA-homolog protein
VNQLLLDLARPQLPTLSNFAVGHNSELLTLLAAWLQGTTSERCVYLWGVPGSGKSHLLRSVDAAASARGEMSAYVANSDALVQCLSSPLARLAVDDVQMLGAEGEAMLFSLLNRAAQGELRLLLSGSNAPAGLGVRADVRTRIGAALVFQVQPLSDEDKIAALRGHASERGFDLSDDVAEYLLRHGRRDLPSLMVVLDALDRYSLEVKRPVTVPLAREVLQASRDAAR